MTNTTFYIEELSSPLHTENGQRFWSKHGTINNPSRADTLPEAREMMLEIEKSYGVFRCSAPELRVKMVVTTEVIL